MRQYGQRGRVVKLRVDIAVDSVDNLVNCFIALFDAGKNRALAHGTVGLERADKFFRLPYRTAMPGQVNLVLAGQQFVERCHVIFHRTIGQTDGSGRPRHNMIARKQQTRISQCKSHMVTRVAGGGNGSYAGFTRVNHTAVFQLYIRF